MRRTTARSFGLVGLVTGAFSAAVGCDAILGLQHAELYEPDAGSSSSSSSSSGGTSSSSTSSSTSSGTGGTAGSGGAGGCTPGSTASCYDGPAGTAGVGVCVAGVKTCNAEGTGFGPCNGEVTPTTEVCAAQQDTNCDGFLCGETEWSQGVATVGNDTWSAVAVDPAGNIYVTGTFTGPMKIGDKTLVGFSGTDVFVAKLDPTGKVVWAKQFGDVGDQSARSIAVDQGGNVVITGSTSAIVDFGKGPVSGLTYVLKLDAAGDPVWSTSCGGTQPTGTFGVGGVGVALDASGDVILAGTFGGTANCGDTPHASSGGLDILLAKLAGTDGHAMWTHTYGDAADQYVRGLAVDSGGNIIITGPENGSVSFGGMPLVGAGFYVARFLPSGSPSWSREWGTASKDYSTGIAVNSVGGPVVVGTYRSTSLTFGGSSLPAPSASGTGAFLLVLDSSGSHAWSRGITSASGQGAGGVSAAVKAADSVVFAGSFSNDIDANGTMLTTGGLSSNTFVVSFDSSGGNTWARAFTGTATSWANPSFVAVDPTDAVSLIGVYTGNVDFGKGTLSSSDPGTADYFLVKLAPP